MCSTLRTSDHILRVEPTHLRTASSFRQDLHTLFDRGYMTVTPNHQIEVSPRIREESHNGKEYYKLHGEIIQTTLDLYTDEDLDEMIAAQEKFLDAVGFETGNVQ